MKWLLLAAMTILPGSWLTFGMSLDELNWRTRVALGTALSPVVLGLQLVLLRRVSPDFPGAVIAIVFLNLPGLFLIMCSLPEVNLRRVFCLTSCVGLIICSSLVGLMLTLWLAIPNFRTVSWHALLHTDIVYLITRNPFLIEEPDLANVALAAPWIDHVYWSVTGWVTDFPPTLLYPISNIVWLIVTFVLAYELARQAIGLQNSSALLSAGLTFVGTNVLGAAGLLVSGKWEFLGDIRYTPPLGKFVGFETIPFALALIVGLSLVCVMILEKQKNSHCTLAAILLVALGLVYPILFPVGCMLVVCAILLLTTPTGEDPQPTNRVRLQLAVAFCVALFTFAVYLSAMTSDRSVSTFQLHTLDNFTTATRYAVVALLPILALAAPLIRKAFLVGKKAILLLTLAGLGSMALYLLFSLSNLEYKFLLAAALLLTPIAVGGIETLFPRSLQARWRWYVSAALPLALVLFFLFLIFKTGLQIPDNLANTPKMIEDSFWLQLDHKESDSGWTAAVRHRTPENTIVVLHESRVHIASFANRALFFPGFGDGDAMAGYSVPKEYYLIEQRGYPKVKFDSRSSTVRTIYTESDEDRLADALRTLLELQRPIAVHFSNRYTPVLLWLKKNNVGEELYSDSKNIVWFINRQVAASIPNRSATHAAGLVSAISSARKDADFRPRERR